MDQVTRLVIDWEKTNLKRSAEVIRYVVAPIFFDSNRLP